MNQCIRGQHHSLFSFQGSSAPLRPLPYLPGPYTYTTYYCMSGRRLSPSTGDPAQRLSWEVRLSGYLDLGLNLIIPHTLGQQSVFLPSHGPTPHHPSPISLTIPESETTLFGVCALRATAEAP